MKFLFVIFGTIFIATSSYGYTSGGINSSVGASCVQAQSPLVCGWCASADKTIPGNCSSSYAGCVDSWQRAVQGQVFVGPEKEVVWVPDTANNTQTTWLCGENGWEAYTTFMASGSGDRSDGWCQSKEYFSTKDNRCHACPDTNVYSIDKSTGMLDLNFSIMAGTGTGTKYNPSTMCEYKVTDGVEYGDATGRFVFITENPTKTCTYDTVL